MHFLCLHGIGTNSDIFQAQTAAIRFELGDEHTYDFVDGPIACEPANGIERMMASKAGTVDIPQCYSYFDWYSPESILSAIDWLSSYIETNGPYDGVIAFSQGTCLVSTLMLQHSRLDLDGEEPLFKCVILFSGILPLNIEALELGRRVQFGRVDPSEAQYSDSDNESEISVDESDGELVEPFQIPSAHIWGTNDDYPLPQGARVSELFAARMRSSVTHQEGHSIPGARMGGNVSKIVRQIRKTIERAEMAH
ncbi:uncharacterized protein BDR25DRAFT_105115 [Lindgomyces ingoldianus]|uniref:Uncharacterized protein n=1 Tax=Lindgomyces ingoldianus TaxID=673940 RepID=A0ACB6QA26_9PLEO|nr:uncharacterized protein BDR25DRAFT_105115 [Lindgomyces ingoldianus]KAF2463889.1 hypothetical protein BDR25DRAFT_105115 [Lindgomyces ingoldianus]